MPLPAPSTTSTTPPYLGVTPPISLDHPTAAEKEATVHLEAYMRALGSYESEDMATARKQALAILQTLAEEWCEGLRHEKEGVGKTTAAVASVAVATPMGAPSSSFTSSTTTAVTVTTSSSSSITTAASSVTSTTEYSIAAVAAAAEYSAILSPAAAAAAAAAAPPPPPSRPPSPPKPVLLPFGSYRLDCHDPTSDLDLLLIAPHGKKGGREREGGREGGVWMPCFCF